MFGHRSRGATDCIWGFGISSILSERQAFELIDSRKLGILRRATDSRYGCWGHGEKMW